ncbi:MAG: protein kinase [Acidobacteria bacterium]|nr:protein kinase [Acidobacteriota bacterium]MBA3885328.1 protein kinase [Acidobacteriota bacterium]
MAPTLISHYRLLDQLGEGGMGVVYRAEDVRLGREVAIKLLRTSEVPSAEWLARFEREARLASSLQHPHICTIHELGEHEGQPFLAMERLEGRTLRQVIDDPMPAQRVIGLARQAADALDAAHRRGIIHRDIKPANLFVSYGDHLKVLDFGLAKLASAGDVHGERAPSSPTLPAPAGLDLTRAGDRVGTTAYMSPEQALGQPLDARTDLFSLGSVIYEMATGRRAFGGDDIALIVTKIINGILVPPSTVNAAIPAQLEAIVLRLLAVDPANRYQTAAELIIDLSAAAESLEPREEAAALSQPRPIKRARLQAVVPLVLGALVLAGVARWTLAPRGAALTDRDSLLVAAFENTTGDPMFDDALIHGLKVQLGQSPFLDIVPDARVRETLRLMGRPDDEALTASTVREVCERMGVRAMLEGSIAPLGANYVLTLNATECQTGEPLARAQGEATSDARVLAVLGSISSSIRQTLGESLPTLERFDVPIEQATTPSLAALKAYTLGLEERRRGRELESVAFFNQATELDPHFAAAYATLSTVYGSLGEWRRSEEFARKAYDLRDRVSERERLFITYQFHDRVTGDQDKAAATLELWRTQYLRESRPSNALAVIHNRVGRYEQAEAEAREALRRTPGHPFPLSNLALTYRALGRYDDARRVAEEAVALGVETSPTRRLLYQLGMLTGDGSADAHVTWAKDRPREFDLVSAQAEVAAFDGRMQEAGELYQRAADMALARRLRGTASGYAARVAWTEVLYRPAPEAAARVRRVVALIEGGREGPGSVPRFRGAAAYALAGMTTEAQAIVAEAEQRYPESTLVRDVLAPSTRAALALRQGRAQAALDALEATRRTETGTMAGLVPVYLRAEAMLMAGSAAPAAREYQRILEHRGVDPFTPLIPLAHLGIARARALAGDAAGSRQAYEALFELWRDADADLAPLTAARAEYARLSTLGPVPEHSSR